MSLDDTTATQYHGPDALLWYHPDGRSLWLSPSQWERAQRDLLALTADQQHTYSEIKRIRTAAEEKSAAELQAVLQEAMAAPLVADAPYPPIVPKNLIVDGIISADNIQPDPVYDGLFLTPDPASHLTVTDDDRPANRTYGEWRRLWAERDTAREGERFWRRLTIFASAACVVGTGINILNATGII